VRSTARLFAERTGGFLVVCYGATLGLLALAGWWGGLSAWFFVAMVGPAWLLGRQIRLLDIHDPGLCLRLFHSNREAGLAIGLAVLVGRW
jgi:4-hydroxybenzoate polyprenyltransferase